MAKSSAAPPKGMPPNSPQSPDNAGTGVSTGAASDTLGSGASQSSSGSGSATSSSTIGEEVEAEVKAAEAGIGAESKTLAGDIEGAAAKTLGALHQPSASIAAINTPEAAMTALKGKASLLHKIVHDAGHVGSLAITEAEALVSDMRFLFSYIHTKL